MRKRICCIAMLVMVLSGCGQVQDAAGNMKVGNDKAFLIRVISQCLPFIGYPRSLNALACVNKAAEADAK